MDAGSNLSQEVVQNQALRMLKMIGTSDESCFGDQAKVGRLIWLTNGSHISSGKKDRTI
jgi:hypothetical protein